MYLNQELKALSTIERWKKLAINEADDKPFLLLAKLKVVEICKMSKRGSETDFQH